MSEIMYHAGRFVHTSYHLDGRCPICGGEVGGYDDLDFSGEFITLSFSCPNCGHSYTERYDYNGFTPERDVLAHTFSVISGPALGEDPSHVEEFDDEMEARIHYADVVRGVICRDPASFNVARVGLVREGPGGVTVLAEYVDQERGRFNS